LRESFDCEIVSLARIVGFPRLSGLGGGKEGTMTDAKGGGDRAAMEQRIVQRSLEDDAFRQQLLADPRAAVEQELGAQLPSGVRVQVVEETADTIYLVIPPSSEAGEDEGELSDSELESVAGGWDHQLGTGYNTCRTCYC
jgi:hypothetical protein